MRNPEQPSVRKVKQWPSWEEGLLNVTRLGHGTGDEVLCGSQSIVDRGRAGKSRGELLTHRGAHALKLGDGDELHADIGNRLDGRRRLGGGRMGQLALAQRIPVRKLCTWANSDTRTCVNCNFGFGGLNILTVGSQVKLQTHTAMVGLAYKF